MRSIEPFDKLGLRPYSSDYLSGFLSERFDLSMDELFEKAQNRASSSSEKEILSRVHSYSTKIISNRSHNVEKNNSSEYVLLPVWMLNTKYRDEMYNFSMNGQTGKFIGNLPVDKAKYHRSFFGIFAAVTALLGTALMLLF